jgi:hypothetical protein
MFLFKKHKKLAHKQTAIVGFVLAVMSILVTAVIVYGFPLFTAWLYVNGVYALDLFLLGFILVLFLSLQALILFGFPLFYAQDKKSHMTGFQILLYALGWMIVLVGLLSVLAVGLTEPEMDYSFMDDFDFGAIEDVEVVE